VRIHRYDHSRRRHLTMNSNLWVRLAWILRVVQGISGEIFRTKMKEEKEEHAVLLSVLLIMDRGERSGGVCQPATFGAPRCFLNLRKLN
jgi:hypothetical protein